VIIPSFSAVHDPNADPKSAIAKEVGCATANIENTEFAGKSKIPTLIERGRFDAILLSVVLRGQPLEDRN
jgi:hypothetical protein